MFLKLWFEPLCLCSLLCPPSESQLQAQLDSMTQYLIFIQGVSEGLRSEVKTMNNARRKARTEKTQAEDQKLKQVDTHM